MATLLLLKYNNYFNRQLKVLDTALEYYDYLVGQPIQNVNFIELDGVKTTQIINWNYEDNPDYLVVLDDSGVISSRWFVLENEKLRTSQYRLSLRRDVLADFNNQVRTAPIYLNKGFTTKEDPLIFNSEGMSFNQVKSGEIMLKDTSHTAWIVGYYSPNYKSDTPIDIEVPQETIENITAFPYGDGDVVNGPLNKDSSSFDFALKSTKVGGTKSTYVQYYLNRANIQFRTNPPINAQGVRVLVNGNPVDQNETVGLEIMKQTLLSNNLNIGANTFDDFYENKTASEISELLRFNGKVFKTSDKPVTYARVKITTEDYYSPIYLTSSDNANVYAKLVTALNEYITRLPFGARVYSTQPGELDEYGFGLNLRFTQYRVSMEEVNNPYEKLAVKIPSSANLLTDAPYKMFAIPYDSYVKIGAATLRITPRLSLATAKGIIDAMQTNLYDIQLLPYCPILDWFQENGIINQLKETANQENVNYNYITDGATKNLGAIFYPTSSSFSGKINRSIDITADGIDFKAERETTSYRLVAPNYSTMEEIDPWMNEGIRYLTYDCTYKPFTPYIRVVPLYRGLYGKNFDDNRGLILGGDYSLPTMSDAWRNYEINNKNYANIFDREVESAIVNHKWDTAHAIAGSLTGTASGAAIGAAIGGPIGAVGGGLASGTAGVIDVIEQQARFRENMDLKKDLYNYSLQNIKARPRGLVKTSSFNINSKIYPFIEVFKATDKEIEAFKHKLKYNGMTLNVIGQIEDYLNPIDETFIQGDLIRIEGINEDSHIAVEIGLELQKGVFIR